MFCLMYQWCSFTEKQGRCTPGWRGLRFEACCSAFSTSKENRQQQTRKGNLKASGFMSYHKLKWPDCHLQHAVIPLALPTSIYQFLTNGVLMPKFKKVFMLISYKLRNKSDHDGLIDHSSPGYYSN